MKQEKNNYMNVYEITADAYRLLVKNGVMPSEEAAPYIKIFEFLGTCSEDEIYKLMDSGVFNNIFRSYVEEAMYNVKIDADKAEEVLDELKWLLCNKSAAKIKKDV